MTFATPRAPVHAALARGWLGQSECSASEPATRANSATKRLDRNNKIKPENVVLYRLTEEGLEGKKLPIPIPQRRRPYSKGK